MNAKTAMDGPLPDIDQVIFERLPSGYLNHSEIRKALRGTFEFTPSFYHRCCTKGVRGSILASWMLGGRRVTTREAVAAFLRELNTPQASPATPLRSPAARSRDHAKAEVELSRVLG